MGKKFYISDLHFACGSQLSFFDKRPFKSLDEMHESMIRGWNGRVSDGDEVYILGDIGRKTDQLIKIFSRLNGTKYLIKGNHDDLSDPKLCAMFEEITDYKEVIDVAPNASRTVVLCHYPILFWNRQHQGSIHLYGHLHNTQEEILFQNTLQAVNNTPEIRKPNEIPFRAFNVGVMMPYMDYAPRTLNSILDANGFSINVGTIEKKKG